jgi:tetratricopeptide (TPR) repeat protein
MTVAEPLEWRPVRDTLLWRRRRSGNSWALNFRKVDQVYIRARGKCYSSRVRFGIWLLAVLCALSQTGLQQAVSLAREGRYAEARRALSGVREPDEVRQKIAFHRLKAAIASGLKEGPAAAEEMRAALTLAPADAALQAGTAVAELAAGQFPEGVRAYQEAIRLAPENELYRIALATTLIQHQAFEAAIGMLKTSQESARLLILLGLAQYGHGDNEDAIESLEKAIALDPKLESAKRCLAGIVLESAKLPPKLAVDLLCAWDKTVCAALKVRRAREEGDRALEEEAVALLKQEDTAVAYCALGRVYEWRNQMKDAAVQMESCVRLDPTPQHHYVLALIYRKLGKTELAHRELELRSRMLQQISEEATLSLNALAAFQRQN